MNSSNASSTIRTMSRSRSQTLLSPASTSKPAVQQATATLETIVPSRRNVTSSRDSRSGKQSITTSSLSVSLPLLEPQQTQQQQDQVNSFEDLVQQSSTPILVDFYAPWCGPCQLMSKVVAGISEEMDGDLKVMKINTDSYPKLANKYRIQALPTCLLFRDGVLIDRVDGFMPEPGFGKRIRFYVARLDKKFGRR